MIKKYYYSLLNCFLLLMVFLSGCSVKEQREACPCQLVLDLAKIDKDSCNDLRLSVSSADGPIYNQRSVIDEFWPEYTIAVPRSELAVNVYSGEGECFDQTKGIRIPYGEECPRIYMHSSLVDTRYETVRETVEIHKNHCVVDLYLENDAADSRYELCLKGNVCGYGWDGQPVQGEFSFRPDGDSDRCYRACLPRQLDASLMLEIDDGSEVLKTFSLGEYIVAGGYDWDAQDLEDLTVHINWTLTSVILTVSGWDWIYECEIVI